MQHLRTVPTFVTARMFCASRDTVNSLIATTSRKQPPPISDHFVVPQGWSLTRELTLLGFPMGGAY